MRPVNDSLDAHYSGLRSSVAAGQDIVQVGMDQVGLPLFDQLAGPHAPEPGQRLRSKPCIGHQVRTNFGFDATQEISSICLNRIWVFGAFTREARDRASFARPSVPAISALVVLNPVATLSGEKPPAFTGKVTKLHAFPIAFTRIE